MRAAGVVAVGIAALAAIGCTQDNVIVTPSSAPNTLFATWEIDSLRFGPLDCAAAGAKSVGARLVALVGGERTSFVFACADYQATSGAVDVGRFGVVLDLLDAKGRLIDELDAGTANVSEAGSFDLGHFVFQIP